MRLFLSLLMLGSLSEVRAADFGNLGSLGDLKKFSIRAQGGVSSHSYSLAGTGFQVSLPQKFGMLAGGEVRYRFGESGFFTRASYRYLRTTHTGLSGLTPASIEIVRQYGEGVLGGNLLQSLGSGLWERLAFSIGAAMMIRTPTLTTPNEVVTASNGYGLLLQASLPGRLGSEFDYEITVKTTLPFIYRESGQSTGSYSSGLAIEGGLSVGYAVTEIFEIGLGFTVRREAASFAGTGSRGVTQGSESTWLFLVPGELRFNF